MRFFLARDDAIRQQACNAVERLASLHEIERDLLDCRVAHRVSLKVGGEILQVLPSGAGKTAPASVGVTNDVRVTDTPLEAATRLDGGRARHAATRRRTAKRALNGASLNVRPVAGVLNVD